MSVNCRSITNLSKIHLVNEVNPPNVKKNNDFFHPRQWQLTIAAAVTIILLAQTGKYAEWCKKLDGFVNDFYQTKDHTDTDFRLQMYGETYRVSQMIKENLKEMHIVNPVLLFQPTGYFQEQHITMAPPEPAVFYNYTGLRSVYMNNPDAQRVATHFIRISNKGMEVVTITTPKRFAEIVAPYKRYLTPYHL